MEHFVELVSLEEYNALSDDEKEAYEKDVVVPALVKILNGVGNSTSRLANINHAYLAMKLNLYLTMQLKK